MTDKQLEEIQQQLFHQLGHKVDIYHFEKHREIVVIRHGEVLQQHNVIKVLTY